MLFTYSPYPVQVRRVDGASEQEGYVIFDIGGPDVPDVPEVTAICTVEQNRAGQRLIKMSFQRLT